MEVPGAPQPAHTPAIQELRAVGVKTHLALSLARFSVARHRLYKQKLNGVYADSPLLEMVGTADRVEILRSKSLCNVCRVLDRVSAYVIAEVIRPHALAMPPDLHGMLFNLCIVRAYINDSVRASFMGTFDYRNFDPSQFVRKVQRCLLLSGRSPDQDIASSAYNVGTFRKYHAAGEKRRGSGTKKRSVAHFFKLLAVKIPAAVAAMREPPRSAEKTFNVLREMLQIATFPAYNIALDLGYYDRTLCDEDLFHYIGPGACPAVHFLRGEPWREAWVQMTDLSAVKTGQRVRRVELDKAATKKKEKPAASAIKTEAKTKAQSDPKLSSVGANCQPGAGAAAPSAAKPVSRWGYGVALSAIKAKHGGDVRVRWDARSKSRSKIKDAHKSATAVSSTGPDTVVHSGGLFKRVLKPPAALTDQLYVDAMLALRNALPDLFAAIGIDPKVEFSGCPMMQLPDGRTTMNLQYVESSLCEYRKFTTEQPELMALCGKMRTRDGLKYTPRRGGCVGAAGDYARWLGVVQRCVVESWGAGDRTARRVWAAADLAPAIPAPAIPAPGLSANAGDDAMVVAAAAAVVAAAKFRARQSEHGDDDGGTQSPVPGGAAETAGAVPGAVLPLLLHHDVSARVAADLGHIVDAIGDMCASLEKGQAAGAAQR